jgi:hypothetical protein
LRPSVPLAAGDADDPSMSGIGSTPGCAGSTPARHCSVPGAVRP